MNGMDTWSVAVTRAGGEQLLDFDDETAQEKISDLMDLLTDYEAAVSYGPDRYTVRLALETTSAEAAVSEALSTVQTYAEKVGLPPWPFVWVQATEWSEFERKLETPTFPNVLGVSELSRLLGVSRQRASELARSKHFPKPFAELAAGPIWLEPTISRFVREWERRPGRPKSEAV
jgi:hypothetical protein